MLLLPLPPQTVVLRTYIHQGRKERKPLISHFPFVHYFHFHFPNTTTATVGIEFCPFHFWGTFFLPSCLSSLFLARLKTLLWWKHTWLCLQAIFLRKLEHSNLEWWWAFPRITNEFLRKQKEITSHPKRSNESSLLPPVQSSAVTTTALYNFAWLKREGDQKARRKCMCSQRKTLLTVVAVNWIELAELYPTDKAMVVLAENQP